MKLQKSRFFLALLSGALCVSASAETKPLKALLLTGGCCHDYKAQTEILKKGLEERINVTVDQIHVDDSSTKPKLPIYGNADYGKGYDLIIHDECAADVKDEATVKAVLKPHQDGIPALALHCAMHSYRVGEIQKPAKEGTLDALWFEFLGVQSFRHGAQKPIEINFGKKHPTTAGMKDWTTGNEELYNNVKVFDTAEELAKGKQEGEKDAVVIWTNLYGKDKVRVFCTTIGHNNTTVSDPQYLDLVAKGVLWATDKMDTAGKPKAGYGRQKK